MSATADADLPSATASGPGIFNLQYGEVRIEISAAGIITQAPLLEHRGDLNASGAIRENAGLQLSYQSDDNP